MTRVCRLGGLIGVLCLALGAGAQQTSAAGGDGAVDASPSFTAPDAPNDVVLGPGDIVGHSLTIGTNGITTVSVSTRSYDAPTSTNWRDGSTGIGWYMDTNDDDQIDFATGILNQAGVVVSAVLNGAGEPICVATVGLSPGTSTYTVSFQTSCIGDPAKVEWYTNVAYEDVASAVMDEDFAPEQDWAGPALNPNTAPPTTAPVTAPVTLPPGPGCVASAPLPLPTGGGEFVPVVPARLLDTRSGSSTFDCVGAGTGLIPAGGVVELQVAGRAGIPVDAVAVALNVTVTQAQGPGFVTAYPCGEQRPTAANLNYVAGATVPNLVIAKIGAGGKVCLYSFAATHLVADVNGFAPRTSAFVAVTPFRSLDTRQGSRPAAGSVTEIQIAGRNGVPADAAAASLNLAVVSPSGPGFITVFPCGSPKPFANNLTYETGQIVPNAVVAKIGVDGKVCVFTSAATHLVIDMNGWFPVVSSYQPMSPARLLDTRDGTGASADAGNAGVRAAGSVTEVVLAGRAGIPEDAAAVVLNVAVTQAAAAGFVTVFPCGAARPDAANLNYVAGQTVTNAVIAKVGVGGKVCVFASGATHLVVDVNGTFAARA